MFLRASTWSVVRRTSFGLKYSARILSATRSSSGYGCRGCLRALCPFLLGKARARMANMKLSFLSRPKVGRKPSAGKSQPSTDFTRSFSTMAQFHTWHLRKVYGQSFSKNVHLVSWVTAFILLLLFTIVF